MRYNVTSVPNGYYSYYMPHWEKKELVKVFENNGEKFCNFLDMSSPRRLDSFPIEGIFECSNPENNLNLTPEEVKCRVQELTQNIKNLLGGLTGLTGIRCTCDEKTLCVSIPENQMRFYFLLDVKLESTQYMPSAIGKHLNLSCTE